MELLEKAKELISDTMAKVPVPEATIADVDLKGLGLDGSRLVAKVSVANPYVVPIPIGEIVYVVKSDGRVIASGSIPDPGSLKASGSTQLEVTVKVPHSAVVSLARDIGADWDIDYALELGLVIDLPLIGNITIPISYKAQIKLPSLSDFLFGSE